MDKKLLDSLSNFSVAIDNLVEELKKKETTEKESSGIFKGMFGVKGISVRLQRMEKSIKEIKEDTTKIIKNQDKLLSLQKAQEKQEKSDVFSKSGDKGQMDKIKEGVGSIILIAGAVLAIGLAFKLVGKVDVLSVIALGISIGIMGAVLAKLSENGIPSPMESLSIGLSLLSMTAGVVASSFLLTLIPDIEIKQLLTFGLILLMFSALSVGISILIDGVKGIKPQEVLYLPLVLIGISLAIMASSFILQHTQIIPGNVLLNIILMGITLGIMALVMSIPIFLIGKMGGPLLKGAFLSVLILPAISLALMLSSLILGYGDYSKPLPLGWVFSFAIAMLILALPVAILGMIPLPIVLMGALALVIISAAIVLSSYILSFIDTEMFYKMADSIEYFIDKVGGAIIRFAREILPILIKTIKSFIDEVGPSIVKFAKEFLPVLISAAKSFVEEVGPPLAKFINEILPPLIGALTELLNSAMPIIIKILDIVKEAIGNIDDIINSISGFVEKLGDIFPKIGEMMEKVGNGLSKPLLAVRDIIKEVGNTIEKIIKTVVNAVLTLSKLDPTKLRTIGSSLGVVGDAVSSMTGGWADIAKNFVGGVEDPVTRILKGISTYGPNVSGVGQSINELSKGIKLLNDIDIEDEKINKVVSVLSKIGDVSAKISVDKVNTSILEGTNLINDIKSLADPQNEEMLNELRQINQQLAQISSNSSTISSQLNDLGSNDEPKLKH